MLQVKLLTPDAKAPERGTEGSAGYDLFSADEPRHLMSGKVSTISTGVSIKIPQGYVALIKPRSGLAVNHGVDTMAGVIDSDYRGELKVLLTTHDGMVIHKGDKIAQLILIPCLMGDVMVVAELDETKRGSGGFGSTGKN